VPVSIARSYAEGAEVGEPSGKSRPLISTLPSSVNWRRHSFRLAMPSTGFAVGK
jgi:hypothetical protein